MAASNRRSATVHPSPLPSPPTTASASQSPLRTLFKIFSVIFLLALILLSLLFFPLSPTFHLISVSSATTTNNATWHMSLKVSNPSRLWSISYGQSHVILSYTDNDFEFKVIAKTYLGPFVQRPRAQMMFNPHLSVNFTDSVGKLFVERIVKDQTQGLASFQVKVTFPIKSKMYGSDWDTSNVFCRYINIVFNKSGSGVASDLPMKCKFVR